MYDTEILNFNANNSISKDEIISRINKSLNFLKRYGYNNNFIKIKQKDTKITYFRLKTSEELMENSSLKEPIFNWI